MRNGYRKTLVVRGNGQSLVEFAMILPLMVLVIAGIVDLGRAFYASITISNAAREGARYGTLNSGSTPGDFQNICNAAFNEALSSHIILDYGKIKIMCGNTNSISQDCFTSGTPDFVCPQDEPITVQVGYTYQDMLFSFFFPTGIEMAKQVEMLVP